MDDPYKTLGISKSASADEVKKAYRKLAKQHHPDLNPGNNASASRFKDISGAYDLLSDPEKRARFDRGEIDAAGQERADASFYRSHAGGPQGARYRAGAGFDPSDIFADMFSRGGQPGGGGFGRGGDFREFKARGNDVSYSLSVDFIEAAKGAQKRLSFPDGKTLDVNVPAGAESGMTLRLRGQGQPGMGGGPSGDALIEITVEPHPQFRREGNNIQVEVPITLSEAVAGGKINVPTIDGLVSMTVPAGSNTGTKMRLRGRGITPKASAAGDQYITLKVMLPSKPDEALKDFVKDWPGRDYDVRDT
jgi:DnaJ-class molecular chaperone